MDKIKIKSLFLSDIHIGSLNGKPGKVLNVIKKYDFECLYLVGDIVDILSMKRKLRWTNDCNKLVRKILKLSGKTKVVYITGNHDAAIRKLIDDDITSLGKITLCNHYIHRTTTGEKILVIHGDQLDGFAITSPWLYNLGDFAYEILVRINNIYNKIRAIFGMEYWSLSGHIKKKVKSVTAFLEKYKTGTVMLMDKYGCDGILMGHLHIPEISTIEDRHYYNTGDFVDSCTYIIEKETGEFLLCNA